MKQEIRTIVVDDENRSRNILKQLIVKYCPELTLVGEACSVESAKQLIENENPDLIFLDVEMPYGSGFDLLKAMNEIDFEVVFVTGFDQYAIKAIKYHALDYMLKPIDISELEKVVVSIVKNFKKKNENERLKALVKSIQTKEASLKIMINGHNGREVVRLEDILRCEAEGSCTWFNLVDGRKLLSTKNLGEYDKLFPKENSDSHIQFMRVHHAHLVNLNYVQKYCSTQRKIHLSNGCIIQVAQRRSSVFTRAIKEFNLGF